MVNRVWGVLLSCFFAASVQAAPISVGGFTFSAGEEAFADEAILVSGVITGADEPTIETVLVGSNIADSFNTGDSGGGIVEVRFTDNRIVNGPGTDLVIFELSGDRPVGTPDSAEIFGLSVFDGTSLSAFATLTPIATGFPDPADPRLDVFAVEVDLSSFGMAPGAVTDRVSPWPRLRSFGDGCGPHRLACSESRLDRLRGRVEPVAAEARGRKQSGAGRSVGRSYSDGA